MAPGVTFAAFPGMEEFRFNLARGFRRMMIGRSKLTTAEQQCREREAEFREARREVFPRGDAHDGRCRP